MRAPSIVGLFLSVVLSPLAACQEKADMQLTVSCVDEAGVRLKGVAVGASIQVGWMPGDGFGKSVDKAIGVTTDGLGIGVLTGATGSPQVFYGVHERGF
jgi:hypothetical protein